MIAAPGVYDTQYTVYVVNRLQNFNEYHLLIS